MGIAIIFLSFAVITDFLSYKIPNYLIIIGFLLGIYTLFKREPVEGIIKYFFYMTILFLFLFPFFLIGGIGAGDIKLLCVLIAFLPEKSFLTYYIYLSVFSVIIIVVKTIRQKDFQIRFHNIAILVKQIIYNQKFSLLENKEEMKKKENVIRLSIPAWLSMVTLMLLQ